jgi:DNA-binding transcriptional regulator YiaG
LLRDLAVLETGFLEQRIADARRKQLELLEEINSKLRRVSQIADYLPTHSLDPSTIIEPHSAAVAYLRAATQLSGQRIGELVGVSRQTIHNWEQGLPIAATKRIHLLAVRDVIERATLQHSTVVQLAAWLDTPRGSDGRTPAQLLAAGDYDRARLLAVTTPTPGVLPPPPEADRPVPPAFRAAMGRPEAVSWPFEEPDAPEEDEEPDTFRPVAREP